MHSPGEQTQPKNSTDSEQVELAIAEHIRAIADAASGSDVRWNALEALYPELRRIARVEMAGQPGQTLQVTALVHETVMKLLNIQNKEWNSPTHFFHYTGTIMRCMLIDHARRRRSRRQYVSRSSPLDRDVDRCERALGCDVGQLEAILRDLRGFDPVGADLVDQRFILGRQMTAVADSLGLSLRTAQRKWRSVRAWIMQELSDDA